MMRNKRNLDRERLEVILMHILMRIRHYLLIVGVFMLILSLYLTTYIPIAGFIGMFISFLFLLPFFSFQFVLYTAKAGAWLGTIGTKN